MQLGTKSLLGAPTLVCSIVLVSPFIGVSNLSFSCYSSSYLLASKLASMYYSIFGLVMGLTWWIFNGEENFSFWSLIFCLAIDFEAFLDVEIFAM